MSALRAQSLFCRFGAVAALDGVSLELQPGARHALIGPNGAGKTTLINVLTGVIAPSAGEVLLGGERVTALPPHERVRHGLARTFQVSSPFPGFTPGEAVLLAILERRRRGTMWWRPVSSCDAERAEAAQLLESLGLGEVAGRPTRELAYGHQRLLEIALALAARPRVLLLDEPAAGIAAGESARVLEAVSRLPHETAVLFIEHDMDLVFRFAQRITVLVAGRVMAEDTLERIAADPRVREAYLGSPADA
jgi:branched-chain amino acid transport system ATP-binding protein